MRVTGLLMVGSAVLLVALLSGVRADEQKVPLDKVPKAVLDAVKKRFPSAELVEAAKETEGGKTEFEVSIKDSGHHIDVMVTPKGSITVIEKEISVKDLPKVVRATLKKEFPKAKYKKAEEVTKVNDGNETLDFYEVLLETAAKKKVEAQVDPDGKLRKKEEEK
jgi:hypothetical protein